MVRRHLSAIALASLLPCAAWAQNDRYGPDQQPRLRGADLPASSRLLGGSNRDQRLKAPAPASHVEALAGPPLAIALPTSIYNPPPSDAVPVPAPPSAKRSAVRRYSVGREFGVQPDPIPLPAPSVLAYSPEVGQAVLAQQERDRAAAPGPMSPADLDMLEQQQQAADRDADRERIRERARRPR